MIFGWSKRAVAVFILVGTAVSANADNSPVVIKNDSGGHIIDYAIRLASYEQDHNQVRFEGRCDSACTIFLSLPSEKTCISPGAYFRFHSPFGGTAKQDQIAAEVLMEKYPQWVRDWIAANGHLTDKLIKMNYDYAKQFIKPCEQTVAGF